MLFLRRTFIKNFTNPINGFDECRISKHIFKFWNPLPSKLWFGFVRIFTKILTKNSTTRTLIVPMQCQALLLSANRQVITDQWTGYLYNLHLYPCCNFIYWNLLCYSWFENPLRPVDELARLVSDPLAQEELAPLGGSVKYWGHASVFSVCIGFSLPRFQKVYETVLISCMGLQQYHGTYELHQLLRIQPSSNITPIYNRGRQCTLIQALHNGHFEMT